MHIDDLERPRLPFALRALNFAGRPFARGLRLDEDALLASARRRARLSDFGDPAFREPLRVLLSALEREAALSPVGRFVARSLVLQLLVTRLRAEALLRAHPEILEEEVRAPIVILGLPRTGTTHLHNLMSQDPGLRSLPYWESLEPIPDAPDPRRPPQPDPRVRRCAQGLSLLHWAMPLFPLMHEMEPEARHEEIQLLAVAFSTMLFEASYFVPSYRDWYRATDQTPAYRYLRRLLQTLQWLRGPRRWLLKSPQHLEQLGPLLRVFPDARIVQTHRDPVRVTASMCTMAAYGLRMSRARIDVERTGRYWADRIEQMLRASVEGRPLVPAGQVTDVRFHDFMKDDLATVERVYAFFGEPLSQPARAAMRAYLEGHARGRLGAIDYRLEDFGLDAGERRRALRFYHERFGVLDE
ncbi:MAG TPA: sulfotransferase [Myxococcota bacterium]